MSPVIAVVFERLKENRDIFYLAVIVVILLVQRIKVAQRARCPSHIYMVSGQNFVKKQGEWSCSAIQKIAGKLRVELDPRPVDTDPLLEDREA